MTVKIGSRNQGFPLISSFRAGVFSQSAVLGASIRRKEHLNTAD